MNIGLVPNIKFVSPNIDAFPKKMLNTMLIQLWLTVLQTCFIAEVDGMLKLVMLMIILMVLTQI